MQHKYYSCDGTPTVLSIRLHIRGHKVSHQKINNINNYWTYFRTVYGIA